MKIYAHWIDFFFFLSFNFCCCYLIQITSTWNHIIKRILSFLLWIKRPVKFHHNNTIIILVMLKVNFYEVGLMNLHFICQWKRNKIHIHIRMNFNLDYPPVMRGNQRNKTENYLIRLYSIYSSGLSDIVNDLTDL